MNRIAHFTGRARAFAALIAEVYPEWMDRDDVEWTAPGPSSAAVRVPSPCHRRDGELCIYFDGSEVTVSFTHWHIRFAFAPGGESSATEIVRICRWIDAFLGDRVVIVNLMDGSRWAGSSALSVGLGSTLSPRTRDEIGHFIFRHQSATRYEIRSWSGGLDEEHTLTPGGWEREGGRG